MVKLVSRTLIEGLGNYVFFCPLVIALTPALHSQSAIAGYLVASVPIAALGGPLYVLYLKHVWHPLWGIK